MNDLSLARGLSAHKLHTPLETRCVRGDGGSAKRGNGIAGNYGANRGRDSVEEAEGHTNVDIDEHTNASVALLYRARS